MGYREEHNLRGDSKTTSVSPASSSGPGTWGQATTCLLTKVPERTAHVLSPSLSHTHAHAHAQSYRRNRTKPSPLASGEVPNLMASFPNSSLSIITRIQQAR